MDTLSPTLNEILAKEPPGVLHHYTSPEGIIGIVKDKEVWAGNLWYVNDAKEIDQAVEKARFVIEHRLRRGGPNTEQTRLLQQMLARAGAAAKRFYAFSLSEERDLLSQWRAYCPPAGGYSIGLPTDQLTAMASKQGFFLCCCVYDEQVQHRIAAEIVQAFVERYHDLRTDEDEETALHNVVWEFYQYVARFGPVTKHPSFAEEKEWRLVAGPLNEEDEQVDFRAGPNGVIPFFRFQLVDRDNPSLVREGKTNFQVVVGPHRDRLAAKTAIRYLINKHVHGAALGDSNTPFRAV